MEEEVEVLQGGSRGRGQWVARPETGTIPMLPSSVQGDWMGDHAGDAEDQNRGIMPVMQRIGMDHAGDAEDQKGVMIIAEYRIEDDHRKRRQQRKGDVGAVMQQQSKQDSGNNDVWMSISDICLLKPWWNAKRESRNRSPSVRELNCPSRGCGRQEDSSTGRNLTVKYSVQIWGNSNKSSFQENLQHLEEPAEKPSKNTSRTRGDRGDVCKCRRYRGAVVCAVGGTAGVEHDSHDVFLIDRLTAVQTGEAVRVLMEEQPSDSSNKVTRQPVTAVTKRQKKQPVVKESAELAAMSWQQCGDEQRKASEETGGRQKKQQKRSSRNNSVVIQEQPLGKVHGGQDQEEKILSNEDKSKDNEIEANDDQSMVAVKACGTPKLAPPKGGLAASIIA
ncbi:hypothetical protein B0H19DRAFT_1081038 [Mycena capillaripes]|nr:hypothetical protein B0H19DRAFT_1081038 [Mycena capillaripes]